MLKSPQEIWELYRTSWEEGDPQRRLDLFRQSLSVDCVYTDPTMQTVGHEQLAGYMDALRKNIPGVRFITTAFYSHHEFGASKWNLLDGNGNVIAEGISFGEYNDRGLLLKMASFYKMPQ